MSATRRSILLTWAAWVVVIWGVAEAKTFLIPLCLAALLAFVMAPLLQSLKRFRVPEPVGIGICAAALLFPILLAASTLVRETEMLIHEFPEISARINEQLAPYLSRFDLVEQGSPARLSNAETGMRVALAGLRAVFEAGTEFVLVVFFALVMLANRVVLGKFAHRIFDSHLGGESAGPVLDSSVLLIERFLATRLWISVAVTCCDFFILTLFHIPYAFLLASILGFSTWIPAVGFLLGVLPVLIVAWTKGAPHLVVLALYLVLGAIAVVNDHWATPKLLGKSMRLSFLATCLGMFAGERLWGLWGMFLSVPILGVIRVILDASSKRRPWNEAFESKRTAA